VPCSASRVVPGAHRVVGPGTHRGSGPREVHTTKTPSPNGLARRNARARSRCHSAPAYVPSPRTCSYASQQWVSTLVLHRHATTMWTRAPPSCLGGRRPRRPGGHAPCLRTLATPLSGGGPRQLVSTVRWKSSSSPTHLFPLMVDENRQSRSCPARFCRLPLEPARRSPPQPLSIAV
jgi:hypothetical protein